VHRRDLHVRGCNADNVLRDLRNPTRSVSASSFCSTYLQPTVMTTTTTPLTVVSTVPTTTFTTTTTTTTSFDASTTVLCPAAPTASVTCGEEAYGFYSFLISQTAGVSSAQCEQNCLANSACEAYNTDNDICNLFTENVANGFDSVPGGGYLAYDRDCPDNAPAVCSAHPSVKKRQASNIVTPTYLATVPASRISSACSCFITSPDAAATNTVFVPSTTIVTTFSLITDVLTTISVVDATTTIASTASP